MSGSATANGSPPTAGVGCSSAGQPHRADRLAQLRADRAREVLDVRHLHDHRLLGAAVTQTLCGRSARSMRRATIACSRAVLVGAQQLLAEVVVDRRIGAAARRARERERARAHALAADQQLRAGGDEGVVAAAGAEAEARRKALAQDAEDRRRVVRRRRVDLHLAREHDLLQRARADALDGARDRGLVVLGRRARRDV